jgi:hypothetical protein
MAPEEAAPVEAPAAPAEKPLTLRQRYDAAMDRFGIYGIDPPDTTAMTDEEAVETLETAEQKIHPVMRNDSLRFGKTLQELRIGRNLRFHYLEQRKFDQMAGRGTPLSGQQVERMGIPSFEVTALPEGGFHVHVPPGEEMVEIPPMVRGQRTVFQRRPIRALDYFLDKEGGELVPYSERRTTDATRIKSTRPVPELEVRPRMGEEAPFRGKPKRVAGAQAPEEPVSPGQRPMAAEAPPPEAAPRFVVNEIRDRGAVVRDQATGEIAPGGEFLATVPHPTPEELFDLRKKAADKAAELTKRFEEELVKGGLPPPSAEEEPRAGAARPGALPVSLRPYLSSTEVTRPMGGPRTPEQEKANAAALGMSLEDYRKALASPLTRELAPSAKTPPGRPATTPVSYPPRPEPIPEGANLGPEFSTKAKFEPAGGSRYRHKETGITVEKNPAGGWDVKDPMGNLHETVDSLKLDDGRIARGREAAMRKYHSGKLAAPEEPAEPEFIDVSDFEKVVEDKFKRPLTEPERVKFKQFADQVKAAKKDSARAASVAAGKILNHWKNVKDIPFEDAVKQIQDAIDQATRPCDL